MSVEQAEAPTFLFGCLEDWYTQMFAATVQRRLEALGENSMTWCPQWWRHPEAVSRLEALWRAWEVCRHLDGEAPARWWWQHFDPIFAVLAHPKRGPLADCKPEQHAATAITVFLPGDPTPAGWWHGDVDDVEPDLRSTG